MVDSENFVIRPLGVLISLPVLELLRQQYGLAFGSTIVDHRNPHEAQDKQHHAAAFACLCVAILYILTVFE